MNCPNCHKPVAVGADECLSCGIILAKFRIKADRLAPAGGSSEPVQPAPVRSIGKIIRNVLLVIFVVIFSIPLLLLALRFPEQARRAMSKGTFGTLGSMRSDISIFYGDEARFPEDLSELSTGKSHTPPYEIAVPHARPRKNIYRSRESIPKAHTIEHRATKAVQLMTGAEYLAKEFKDTGGWAYVVSGPSSGNIMVNCTHTDSHGKSWIAY